MPQSAAEGFDHHSTWDEWVDGGIMMNDDDDDDDDVSL